MRQTELRLSKKDRQLIDSFRAKGLHSAREFNRAHILAALDRGVPEAQIMEVLGVGRTAIWRTRAAYLKGGLEYALHDEARPGEPRQYETEVEAQITALACSAPPAGAHAGPWRCWSRRRGPSGDRTDQPGDDPATAKKNCLKPWRKLMWCIGVLTAQYRQRMYDLLDLYARPFDASEPVICIDEKSKQLLGEVPRPLPVKPGALAKQDTSTTAPARATCSWRSSQRAAVVRWR